MKKQVYVVQKQKGWSKFEVYEARVMFGAKKGEKIVVLKKGDREETSEMVKAKDENIFEDKESAEALAEQLNLKNQDQFDKELEGHLRKTLLKEDENDKAAS